MLLCETIANTYIILEIQSLSKEWELLNIIEN